MKNSITLSITAAALLFGATLLPAQVRYGIRAGLNMSNVQYSGIDDPLEAVAIFQKKSDPHFSVLIGGMAEMDLKKNFTLSGELQLAGRGYHLQAADRSADFTQYHTRLWYALIPVSVTARWQGFFAGAGPYLGIGLWGTQQFILDLPTGPGIDEKSATHFGRTSDDHFRRLDFGVQGQAGYSFRNIRLILSYNLGLRDIITQSYAADYTVKSWMLGLSAAYFLGAGE